jgi:hypothetical protein
MFELLLDDDESLPFVADVDKPPIAVTSGTNGDYNCFGWALGADDEYVSPGGGLTSSGIEWPDEVDPEQTVDAFIEMFKARGWRECRDGSAEPGVVKIALYAVTHNGRVTPAHAARQIQHGDEVHWTSKMGDQVDVRHPALTDIVCRVYGRPVRYFSRAGQLRAG